MISLAPAVRVGEVSNVVGVVIALFVAAVLLPVAFQQIYNTSTTGWNPAFNSIVDHHINAVAYSCRYIFNLSIL